MLSKLCTKLRHLCFKIPKFSQTWGAHPPQTPLHFFPILHCLMSIFFSNIFRGAFYLNVIKTIHQITTIVLEKSEIFYRGGGGNIPFNLTLLCSGCVCRGEAGCGQTTWTCRQKYLYTPSPPPRPPPPPLTKVWGRPCFLDLWAFFPHFFRFNFSWFRIKFILCYFGV